MTELADKEVTAIKDRVRAVITGHAQVLVEVSHEIHARPELNFEETFASALLARTSSQLGLDAELGAYGVDTGVVAETGSGPTVCVMSEYDALPGIGHGCGHNVIAAAGQIGRAHV